MKIAYLYTPGRVHRAEAARSGGMATEFFYGAIQLAAEHEVTLHEVTRPAKPRPAYRLVDALFDLGLLPNRTRGWILLGVRRILADLRRADVVVATSTGLAFSLGIWRALRFFDRPVVAIHCGIFNYTPNGWRRSQIRRLLRDMWSVVFGPAEYPAMRREFDVPDARLAVNNFGVDTSFWCPGEAAADGEPFILSIGNDSRRDYATLLAAAQDIPAKVVLITELPLPDRLPPNVEVRRSSWRAKGLSDVELRDLYRRAACVVVPLVESIQPSGQSVTLQAMACGAPVVLTRTPGLWDVEHLADGTNVLFVPPRDSAAVARAARSVIADRESRRRIGGAARDCALRHSRVEDFASRLCAMCERAVKEEHE